MNPIRILAGATAMEIGAAVALLALAGLGGARNGWLDLINNFAPVILLLALVGAGLGYWALQGATRAVTLGLTLLAVFYGLALTAPEIVKSWVPRSVAGTQFRVLSANVWHDNPTPDLAISSLIARDADALFLQESDGTLQPRLARLKTQYPFASDCPGSGVQIFAKSPIVAQECGFAAGLPLDMVWIQTHAPDGAPVTLATTHFAWPFPPGLQSAQRRVLAERLHQQPTDMMILGGDFNTTPWSFGMRNQDQLLAPLKRQAAPGASWPARLDTLQRPWGFPILPIDHLYSGPGWRAVGATRLRIPGSDHLAIEATFVRNRPR